VFQPGKRAWAGGLALTLVLVSIFLYSDRDVAPIFGHLSDRAGVQHR
jgi:hypothetical protein